MIVPSVMVNEIDAKISYLSYLLVPAKNKLYLIYNSLDGLTNPLATMKKQLK